MTPETEQRFLAALYERLWKSITHRPSTAQQEVFDSKATFMHLSKGHVLNPSDFVNLINPRNPNGDLRSSELFSTMIDVIPEIKAGYNPSLNRVSVVYRQLLEGATNSSVPSDPDLKEVYNRAYNFLYTTTVVRDHTDQEITLPIPSPIAQTYESKKLAYTQAVSNYQTAYLNYDLKNPQQQREWVANAPLLELAMNQAYNQWRREGAAQVEQARSILETANDSKAKSALNSTLQNLVREALQTMNSSALASINNNEQPWYLSYALPTNWADLSGNRNFSYLKISSSFLKDSESLRFRNFGGGQLWSEGLWSMEESFDSNNSLVHHHLDAEEIELSAKIGITCFERPWLNSFALRTAKQLTDVIGQETTGASVLIPTAFLTAHDIQIKGNFTSKDREHLEKTLNSSTTIGLGPIRLSGQYSHSLSTETFHSTEDGGTITVPGLHVLAWISEIVPPDLSISSPSVL